MRHLPEIKAVLWGAGLIVALVAASRVPAKLDEHARQTARDLSETNRQLRTLVCLQAHLHPVVQCLADTN